MQTLNQFLSELPVERQKAIQEKADELILETGIAMLREELNLSQQQIANLLGVSQPAVVQIEQRGNDIKLATLKRYVEAMGGKLSLSVELPTGASRVFTV
ncbi:XRE family transcriptional regulator [[Haemophilus] felis]|uniref:Transcriptional regulator n=1 Tax=[Haemophilus] felis TaxID=123822 RepID=A0A1T0BAS7_9PAST|nr:XRE family transcriptional regulator [[Haemophilus] felis]NBI40340.1 XRE family transcriptional regulator [[Haemophilus] felis]OOS07072.1 transcriptional regulator [[Haemophilus] felis]